MIPLVLVHGFMGGSVQWEKQVKDLSRDFEIVLIDGKRRRWRRATNVRC